MFRLIFLCVAVLTTVAADPPAANTPSQYDELVFSAREAERKGLLGRALDLLEDARKLNTNRVDAWFYTGRILGTQRKGEEAIAAFSRVIAIDAKASTAYQMRGVEHFKLGNVEKSVADFDRYLELEPQQKPYHWQRGISLYYAGKFEEGKKQFEIHQTVNPDDVENGVWHFICAARASSFEKAREGMMKVSGDRRVPMTEIYRLYEGKGTVDEVLQAARRLSPSANELENRLFYAHLYIALFFEAKGDSKEAYEHMKKAATEYPSLHYMGDVAKVHFKRMLAEK